VTRRRRTALLLAGVAVCLIAVSPPFDGRADATLTAHMTQHMLLALVGPALIQLGSPVLLALRLLPRGAARRAARLGHGRALRLLAAPLLGWALLPALMVAVHTPAVFDVAVNDARVHAAEHLALVAAGLLFWRPVLGADPMRRLHPVAAVAYLLAAMPAQDVVGIWLMSSRGIEYPAYAAAGLADQHRAGVVMLTGSFLLGGVALWHAWRWVQLDERRAAMPRGGP
jgi:cytochrome c oxidase assembly factor CtaG